MTIRLRRTPAAERFVAKLRALGRDIPQGVHGYLAERAGSTGQMDAAAKGRWTMLANRALKRKPL